MSLLHIVNGDMHSWADMPSGAPPHEDFGGWLVEVAA